MPPSAPLARLATDSASSSRLGSVRPLVNWSIAAMLSTDSRPPISASSSAVTARSRPCRDSSATASVHSGARASGAGRIGSSVPRLGRCTAGHRRRTASPTSSPPSMASRAAGARGERRWMASTAAAVQRPTTTVPTCALPSTDQPSRPQAPGAMPSSGGNCDRMISTATPFMNPASTGCGTKRTSEPSRSRPSRPNSRPVQITVAPVRASSVAALPLRLGSIAGSCTRRATSAPRISEVGALGAAAGICARPATIINRPPTTKAVIAAVSPSCVAGAPVALKTISPSVNINGSSAAAVASPDRASVFQGGLATRSAVGGGKTDMRGSRWRPLQRSGGRMLAQPLRAHAGLSVRRSTDGATGSQRRDATAASPAARR